MDVMNSSQQPFSTPTTGFGSSNQSCPDIITEQLLGTKPWVRLIAVIGFVGCGLMVLLGLFAMVAGASMSRFGGGLQGAGAIGGLFYILMGGFYGVISGLLNSYATQCGQAATDRSFQSVANALNSQRVYWKVLGITAIVMIGIFVLVFLYLMVGLSHSGYRY
jgi:hypothetical protein